MSVIDQKTEIFGNIAALKTLTQNYPSLNISSSLSSISNDTNTVSFLSDLIKSLVGYETLVSTLVDILTYSLSDIENDVKQSLKDNLKGIVNCGVNPSLPIYLKSTGSGISIAVDKIDFTDLFMINPTSGAGMLLYNDVTTNLFTSSDLNTFLFETIQNNNTTQSWGGTTFKQEIINFKFQPTDPNGVNPSNTLIINANKNYDTKSLTDFNNDFIESVNFFNTQNITSNIIDTLFGSITTTLNKTLNQLESEAQVNTVIDNLINTNNNDKINSSYFTFTSTDITAQQTQAKSRKNGYGIINTSSPLKTSVSITSLTNLSSGLITSSDIASSNEILTNGLNSMADETTTNSSNQADAMAIKLNFIQQIIDSLIKSFVNTILSPKVVVIFFVNYIIINGQNATFANAIDFIQKNVGLIHSLIKTITEAILQKLLTLALKTIIELVSEAYSLQLIEQGKFYAAQLLSLIGIPQNTLRQLTGLQ